MTQTGAIVGTPIYLAPEQCKGEPVSPRTDVYAMGATLFHLLSERPPFLADTAYGLIAKHCNEAPPPLQTLNREASDGVSRVVAKALARV